MTLLEYFNKYGRSKYQHLFPYVVCKSSLVFSAQASLGHFCNPREDLFKGAYNYNQVELAAPNRKPPDDIMIYLARNFNRTQWWTGVYHRVPTQYVERWIRENGGIDEEACQTQWPIPPILLEKESECRISMKERLESY